MGRWTYYSPLLLGTVLSFILFLTYRELLPPLPAWLLWLSGCVGALLAGLCCQLVLIGSQGAFAQVLPVPSGRSIRGRGAVVTGVLALAGLGLGAVAGLLRAEEGLQFWSFLAGALSLASLLAAMAAYIWSLPAAVRDFADER
jgi:hypothetical protein